MNITTNANDLAEISKLLSSDGNRYMSDITSLMKLDENPNDLHTVEALLGTRNSPPFVRRSNVISNEEFVKLSYDIIGRYNLSSKSFLSVTARKGDWAASVEKLIIDVGRIKSEFQKSFASNIENYIATIHISNDQAEQNRMVPYVTMLMWNYDLEEFCCEESGGDNFLVDDIEFSIREINSSRVALITALFTLFRTTDAEFDQNRGIPGLNKKSVHHDDLIRFCIMSQTKTRDLVFAEGNGQYALNYAIRKENRRVRRDLTFSVPEIAHEEILHYWAEYWRRHDIPYALPLVRLGM